jgi:hypothetical protein|uniref:Uncharacterized protein n=1 Tax=candidate division WOR-3 bacterium TaxID=2052148 RepID=A0A7C6E9Y0_UNCW3
MEIKLTKKQYENLLRLVYLGNWVINSIRPPDELIEKYEELEQYIFSLAESAGLGKYVVFAKEDNRFYPTPELEEDPELCQYLEEYDTRTFWDELIYRLARRDLIRHYGIDEIKKMDPKERIVKESRFIEKYAQEFEKHGIEYLRL